MSGITFKRHLKEAIRLAELASEFEVRDALEDILKDWITEETIETGLNALPRQTREELN